MSLPRVLVLGPDNALNMSFLPELVTLRGKGISLPPPEDARRGASLLGFVVPDCACELELLARRQPFSLTLSSGTHPLVSVSFDPSRNGSELHVNAQALSVPATNAGEHYIHLFLDASVLECIVDHTSALTARVYSVTNGPTSLHGRDVFSNLQLCEVKPISKDRLTS